MLDDVDTKETLIKMRRERKLHEFEQQLDMDEDSDREKEWAEEDLADRLALKLTQVIACITSSAATTCAWDHDPALGLYPTQVTACITSSASTRRVWAIGHANRSIKWAHVRTSLTRITSSARPVLPGDLLGLGVVG